MQVPIGAPFQTMQEVNDYLSGNTITCLVCGKSLQRLNRHIQSMHHLTPEEYRTQFGIPFSRSLTSAPSRAKSCAAMTPERIEQFKRVSAVNDPNWRPTANHAFRVPAVANLWKKNAETGRYFARKLVIVPCVTCGVEMATTALGATQPVRCLKCTTPGAFKARRSYWRKKWAA
ncbi:MAG: MucR family transcriptional regulator [Bryobacteraceae bacterium]|jgi:ROS/MUCR transcriptional regulator protein